MISYTERAQGNLSLPKKPDRENVIKRSRKKVSNKGSYKQRKIDKKNIGSRLGNWCIKYDKESTNKGNLKNK